MSESKRRRAEIEGLKRAHERWVSGLTPAEHIVAEVSERAYIRIVERKGLVSGCYLLAFFLHELFEEKYGIKVDLIVGWMNDGEWAGVASHAWLEMGGKKVDIALGRTDRPHDQPPGDVVILDRVIRPGIARYTYYREPPGEALTWISDSIARGELPAWVVEEKNREHAQMLHLSKTREGVQTYLRECPSDRSYPALARLLE
jgi:hypothetical protein